ncbi:hypothetical protein BGZ91_006849, partial [Linnemannia elongata]
METFIAWANEKRTSSEGQRVEHVSFPSFVKNFTLSDQSSALADYADVLTSSELSAKRRKILQGAHNIFMKSRLPDFWTSWKQQLALDKVQRELDTSSATTAKKTALLAQEACLRESAKSFGNLKQENTSTSTVSIENDTVVYEQDEEQSYQSDSNATTIEPCIALSLSSRTRPFHPLISYVFKKAQDQHAVLLSSIPSDLSGVLREMYSVALKELSKPGSVVDKKDVLVLLSGIINTVAPSGRRFSISKRISQGSRLRPLDSSSADYRDIKDLLEDLLKNLYPAITDTNSMNRGKPRLRSLKRRVWTLLSEADEETARYTILQIVSQVLYGLNWVSLYHQRLSMCMCRAGAPSSTFCCLTHLSELFRELVSKASTQARQKAESEYGPTSSAACGRKVDMSIRIRFDDNWRHEVAIFEFKATTATQAVCEKQQRKSVRLNAALLYDLEAKGLDITKSYPIIAEGQALGLDFYALRRYDEILGAGRSTTKGISLPSHVDQLKAFFESETLFILLSFKEHLREYAFEVTDVLANSAPTPFGYVHDSDDEEDELGTRAEDVSESWDDGDDDYGNT